MQRDDNRPGLGRVPLAQRQVQSIPGDEGVGGQIRYLSFVTRRRQAWRAGGKAQEAKDSCAATEARK